MDAKIETTDLIYLCLHEAATYAAGGSVETIEILQNDKMARGRTRVNLQSSDVKFIAAAGFAIEYLLFRQRRLVKNGVPILEKTFIDESMNNARDDKISFFGSNQMQSDGTWPANLDWEYMNFAIQNVAPILQAQFPRIEELAPR